MSLQFQGSVDDLAYELDCVPPALRTSDPQKTRVACWHFWYLGCAARLLSRHDEASAYFDMAAERFWKDPHPHKIPGISRWYPIYQCMSGMARRLAGDTVKAIPFFLLSRDQFRALTPESYEKFGPGRASPRHVAATGLPPTPPGPNPWIHVGYVPDLASVLPSWPGQTGEVIGLAVIRFTPKFLSYAERVLENNRSYISTRYDLNQYRFIEDSLLAHCCENVAVAARILGRQDETRGYFGFASAFYWPYHHPHLERTIAGWDGAEHQTKAAIMAHFAGDSSRSVQLFGWAADSFAQVPPTYEDWDLAGRCPEPNLSYHYMVCRAYADARAGYWEDVGRWSDLAIRILEAERKRKALWPSALHPLGVAYLLRALVTWRQKPTPENKATVQQMLVELMNRWCRDPGVRMAACIEAWDLQEAFADALPPLVPG